MINKTAWTLTRGSLPFWGDFRPDIVGTRFPHAFTGADASSYDKKSWTNNATHLLGSFCMFTKSGGVVVFASNNKKPKYSEVEITVGPGNGVLTTLNGRTEPPQYIADRLWELKTRKVVSLNQFENEATDIESVIHKLKRKKYQYDDWTAQTLATIAQIIRSHHTFVLCYDQKGKNWIYNGVLHLDKAGNFILSKNLPSKMKFRSVLTPSNFAMNFAQPSKKFTVSKEKALEGLFSLAKKKRLKYFSLPYSAFRFDNNSSMNALSTKALLLGFDIMTSYQFPLYPSRVVLSKSGKVIRAQSGTKLKLTDDVGQNQLLIDILPNSSKISSIDFDNPVWNKNRTLRKCDLTVHYQGFQSFPPLRKLLELKDNYSWSAVSAGKQSREQIVHRHRSAIKNA